MPLEPESKTVLVVEDEWMVRDVIAGEFRDLGWTVLEAANGEVALALLPSQPIDLLVTDIQLGGKLTGWDVAEALHAAVPNIPVFYVSGNATDKSRQLPGSVFFAKPCEARSLVDAYGRLPAGGH